MELKLSHTNKQNRPISKDKVIYIFGDNAELDSRISGKDKSNFEKKIELVRESALNENTRVIIGISRYNFFIAARIAEFVLGSIGKKADLTDIRIDVTKLEKLKKRLLGFIDAINSRLPNNIRAEIYDMELIEILDKFEVFYSTGSKIRWIGLNVSVIYDFLVKLDNFIDRKKYSLPGIIGEYEYRLRGLLKRFEDLFAYAKNNEDDLIRLLSVICEHAFLGPKIMVIDPHHRCNTNCTHCWVHTPSITHPKEFLDMVFPLDRFKRLIDDAAKMRLKTIVLQGDGEPLLHPNSIEMLKYAKSKGVEARFFTNGILLTEEISKKIIDIGVDEIYCSFPAGTPETYKIINPIQKPETYHKVVKNLKRLSEMKKRAWRRKPWVIVTHVIHTQNYHEIIKMAQDDVYEGVDAARFYLIRLDHMNRFLQLKENEAEEIRRQIPIAEAILKKGGVQFVDNIKFQMGNYNQKDGSWAKDVFLKGGCTIGYYFNLVPAKGDISFCCHLRTVGDLSKESFNDIWKSDRYARWRRQAKFMNQNANVKFLNGQKLYDEHCTHCDNHQTLLEVNEKLKKMGLYKYYNQ